MCACVHARILAFDFRARAQRERVRNNDPRDMLSRTMPGERPAARHTSTVCTAMPAPHPSDLGNEPEPIEINIQELIEACCSDSDAENVAPGAAATTVEPAAVQASVTYNKGNEVWVYQPRVETWEPGTVVDTSFFSKDGLYGVTLRTGLKLEVPVSQVCTLTLSFTQYTHTTLITYIQQLKVRNLGVTTVSGGETAKWHTDLYRRPDCLGGLGRDRAIAVMCAAHPGDPYWMDDAKAMREQHQMQQTAVQAELKKIKRSERLLRRLQCNSPS